MDYNTKVILINFDYGNRSVARKFIKEIFAKFDSSIIRGSGIAVNNNPYNLEFIAWFSVNNEFIDDVEKYIKDSDFNKDVVINYFLGEVIENSFFDTKKYNLSTLDDDLVDFIITDDASKFFLFPSRDILNEKFGGSGKVQGKKKVFFSHSSLDKEIVDEIFRELQYGEVAVWYDKYEIELGDSIVEKISEGIDRSDIGIILMTPNFLDNKSWARQEMHTLISRMVNKQTNKIVIINKGVKHENIPPLLQDYRYLNYEKKEDLDELIKLLKKK